MTTIATPVLRVPVVPANLEYSETFRMDDTPPENSSPLLPPQPSPAPAALPQRVAYPSDLTDAQWRRVEPLLPERKTSGRTGRPPRYTLRELLNGILYAQRTGCAWRYLPRDLPHWTSVYAYWQKWTRDGTLATVFAALRLTSTSSSSSSAPAVSAGAAAAPPLTPFPEVVTSPGSAMPASAVPDAEAGDSTGEAAADTTPEPQQRQRQQRRRVIIAVRRSGTSSSGSGSGGSGGFVTRRTGRAGSIVSSRGTAEPMLRGSKGGSGGDAASGDAASPEVASDSRADQKMDEPKTDESNESAAQSSGDESKNLRPGV